MTTLYFILFILFVVAFTGCRQKYEIAYQPAQTSYLVVEGIINTAGTTKVSLSRTTLLSERGIDYETQADVTIEGEDNSLYPLASTDSGTYVSGDLLLNENIRYRLSIKTEDNRQYVSSFVQPIKSPEIDSITWQRYDGGVEVFVNSTDPINTVSYYKFDYEETWEFKANFPSFIYTVLNKEPPGFNDVTFGIYDIINNKYNDSIYTCWNSRNSTEIIVGNTARLDQNKLYMPIVSYPKGARELSYLYSINIKQQALSKDGYDFFRKMKKNTESLGSIFDGQPSEIPGNVRCVTDTLEKVIGFVDASRLKIKRKFINNKDLDGWEVESLCVEELISITPALLYDRLYYQKRMPTRVVYDGQQRVVGLVTAPPECVDCTIKGVHNKPVFWP